MARWRLERFVDWSTVLQQIAGMQINDVLAQYDAQKGCNPRWLCQGNDDGQVTEDEFSAAALLQNNDISWLQGVPSPWSFLTVSFQPGRVFAYTINGECE